MSEGYPEARGVRARYSRWRTTVRGRKTLKAAYTQAARDVKRMDPAVRERIGRAHLTQADLQQLASFHVDAQFRPGRYGDMSQRLGQAANARLQQAGPTPRQPRETRNPLRRIVNRYSRWGRAERRGTKALKAALTQASRDVKRTDPAVLHAIGRSTLNRSDLAALAAGRMDQVFRPEGRFQGLPQGRGQGLPQGRGQAQGQAQGRGQAQGQTQGQAQGVQSRDAVQQVPAQGEQMTQRIAALQQSILENQQRAITLMEENNRLQAQMRQLLEARVQDLQQQVTDLDQAVSPPQLTQEPQLDPGRESPEGLQPENTDDHVRLDNPVIPASEGPQGEQQTGEQAGEAQRGEGEAQAENTGPETASTEEVTAAWVNVPGNPEASVDGPERPGTDGVQNDGVQTDPEAETKEPTQGGQAPTTEAEQPGTSPQQPQSQQAQDGQGPVDPKKLAEKQQIARAAAAAGNVAPPVRSTPEDAARTAHAGKDDTGKHRSGVTPTGRGGR